MKRVPTRACLAIAVGLSSIPAGILASHATGSADHAIPPGATEHISLTTGGKQFPKLVYNESISDDGRYVVFQTPLERRIDGQTRRIYTLFVRDRRNRTTHPISVGPRGPANRSSWNAAISQHGRFIAFESAASNLVKGDTNHAIDIFVRDMRKGTTQRVSIGTGRGPAKQSSRDSFDPSISANGHLVAFSTRAPNLVRGDTNHWSDIFVRNRHTKRTIRVSVGRRGAETNDRSWEPNLSADGRFVAFTSEATNLSAGDHNSRSDIFLRDRKKRVTHWISRTATGAHQDNECLDPLLSHNGRFVSYRCGDVGSRAGDYSALFRRDRREQTVEPVSVNQGEEPTLGWIYGTDMSSNGRFLVFATDLDLLFPSERPLVYAKDMRTGALTLVSEDNSGDPVESYLPRMSGDGRLVTFYTYAQLLPTDADRKTDVYLRRWGS